MNPERRATATSERKSASLRGARSTEEGLLDRTLLQQEIQTIFYEAGGNLPTPEMVEDHMETLVRAGRHGKVEQAADCVVALLGLDLDDLRRGALLSLMVRLTGRRRFDLVAAYLLEKRAAYVTSQA